MSISDIIILPSIFIRYLQKREYKFAIINKNWNMRTHTKNFDDELNQCFTFCINRLLQKHYMLERTKKLTRKQKFFSKEIRIKNVFGLLNLKHEVVEGQGLSEPCAAKRIIKELTLLISEAGDFSPSMTDAIKNEIKIYQAFLFCTTKSKIQVKHLIKMLYGSADTLRACICKVNYSQKLSHMQKIIKLERQKLSKMDANNEEIICQQKQSLFSE